MQGCAGPSVGQVNGQANNGGFQSIRRRQAAQQLTLIRPSGTFSLKGEGKKLGYRSIW